MFKVVNFGTAGKIRLFKTLLPSDTHINSYIYLELEYNTIMASKNADLINYTAVEANATTSYYNVICARWKCDTVNIVSLIAHNRSILYTFKYDTQLDLVNDGHIKL